MVCIYILFIHGHLGFFSLLTIMNSAAMNMGMYIFQDSVFNSFGYIPRSGNAGSLLIFEEPYTISQQLHNILSKIHKGSSFPYSCKNVIFLLN